LPDENHAARIEARSAASTEPLRSMSPEHGALKIVTLKFATWKPN